HLADLPPLVDERGGGVELLLELVEVEIAAVVVAADDHVAAAEVAELLAERQVDVEGEVGARAAPRIGLVRGPDLRRELRRPEGGAEVRRGRVAGVARTGLVVLAHELAVELELPRIHAETKGSTSGQGTIWPASPAPAPRVKPALVPAFPPSTAIGPTVETPLRSIRPPPPPPPGPWLPPA